MATKLRLIAALSALVTAVIVVWHSPLPTHVRLSDPVRLQYSAAPISEPQTTIKWPVVDTTNPTPFDPCKDIPDNVLHGLGLEFTPAEPEEGLRCHFDAGNYQLTIEPVVWRTYEQTLPSDAVEMNINGHRAAQYWVMKPTDWDNRWWFSCMVAFKTSYGVIQQTMFYSKIYSNPNVDCLQENLMRAQQLSPFYIF
jgi:hypothetical protein